MLVTIIVFILILGVSIFVHEFGHFIFAKRRGVKVEEFGFGYPPRILGLKKVNGRRKLFFGNQKTEEIKSEDTIYSLNWLPIGGFVKIKGEAGEKAEDEDSFAHKKIWERGLIISGGVLMNFVLCMILLSIVFSLGSPQVIDKSNKNFKIKDERIEIISLLKDSPAEKAGLKIGDEILEVNGEKVYKIEDFKEKVNQSINQPLNLKIKRFDKILEKKVIPRPLTEFKNISFQTEELEGSKALIGVGLVKVGTISYPWYLAIWKGIKTTIILIGKFIWFIFLMVKGLILGKGIKGGVTGPIGIAVLTNQVVHLGFIYLLQFTALLSLNLGIINILPIPALDGGRLVFLLIEKIRGRKIKIEIENAIHTFGFIALMIIVLIVTYFDLARYGGKIIGVFKRTIGW